MAVPSLNPRITPIRPSEALDPLRWYVLKEGNEFIVARGSHPDIPYLLVDVAPEGYASPKQAWDDIRSNNAYLGIID